MLFSSLVEFACVRWIGSRCCCFLFAFRFIWQMKHFYPYFTACRKRTTKKKQTEKPESWDCLEMRLIRLSKRLTWSRRCSHRHKHVTRKFRTKGKTNECFQFSWNFNGNSCRFQSKKSLYTHMHIEIPSLPLLLLRRRRRRQIFFLIYIFFLWFLLLRALSSLVSWWYFPFWLKSI